MARTSPSTWRSSQPSRGVDGRGWIFLARNPTSSDGRIGDTCWNTVTGHAFGPKTAAGWADNGLIKGDGGWSTVLGLSSDGARRVLRVVDWAGGTGTKPATGQYVGATGLVTSISDGVDVRGAAGPEMLISGLPSAGADASYATLVPTAEVGDENAARPLSSLFAVGGQMPIKSPSNVAGMTIAADVVALLVTDAADNVGGRLHVLERTDSQPAGLWYRSLDRHTATGGTATDSVNGGYWAPTRVASTTPTFPLASELFKYYVPGTCKVVRVDGYHVRGVGGGPWMRVASEPTDGGGQRSADRHMPDGSYDADDGGWWALAEQWPTILQCGAWGDDDHDDGPVFQRRLADNTVTTFPPAPVQYRLDTGVAGSSLNGCHWVGAGVNATKVIKTTNGDALAVNGLQRCSFFGFTWQAGGSMTTGGAVHFSGGGGVNTLANMEALSFPGRGFHWEGAADARFSGCVVQNINALSCGSGQSVPQIEYKYFDDYTVEKCQSGVLDFGGPYAPYGAYMEDCGAGYYSNNLHWENIAGAKFKRCNYMRRSGNRYETNRQIGRITEACIFATTSGEQIHTNSLAGSGLYPGAEWINCAKETNAATSVFEWTSGTILMKNCLKIDAGVSNSITFTGPSLYGAAEDEVDWDPSLAFEIQFIGVQPQGLGLDDGQALVFSFSTAAVAAGATVYAGNGRGAAELEVAYIIPHAGKLISGIIYPTGQPGAGQSYTISGQLDGSNITDFSDVLTGASTPFVVPFSGAQACTAGQRLALKIELSESATSAAFRGFFVFKR